MPPIARLPSHSPVWAVLTLQAVEFLGRSGLVQRQLADIREVCREPEIEYLETLIEKATARAETCEACARVPAEPLPSVDSWQEAGSRAGITVVTQLALFLLGRCWSCWRRAPVRHARADFGTTEIAVPRARRRGGGVLY